MLRKWRRNIERKLDDETGKISVERGVVISAVVGSAVSVLLCTTSVPTEPNTAILVPQIAIASEKNVEYQAQLANVEIEKYDISTGKDFIELFKPILIEQSASAIPIQVAKTNNVDVQDKLVMQKPMIIAEKVQEQLAVVDTNTAESLALVAVANTNLVESEQIRENIPEICDDDTSSVSLDVANVTATSGVETEQIIENISEPLVAKEEVTPEKEAEPVAKTIDYSVETVKSLVSLSNSEQQGEVKISNIATSEKTNATAENVKKYDYSKFVATTVNKNVNVSKPASSKLNSNTTIGESTTKVKAEIIPTCKSVTSQSDRQVIGIGKLTTTSAIMDLPKLSLNNQNTATNDVVPEKSIKNDTIIIQAVNAVPYMYNIADKADGITTVTPNKNAKVGFTEILSSADITVFKVEKGETSYKGRYYTENSKKGLKMVQRVTETIQQPNLDSTKVNGTYLTMDLNNNPSSDFFVGFNGSALVVYPLDNEARTMISATDSVNNRPIVVASIVEAMGNMKINLTQIQSVSIYAE